MRVSGDVKRRAGEFASTRQEVAVTTLGESGPLANCARLMDGGLASLHDGGKTKVTFPVDYPFFVPIGLW
jgi:hypothetical protein